MTLYISQLYGKKIISNSGHWVGEVGEVVLDVEQGAVSHLLLGKMDSSKSKDMMRELVKNSIEFNRVKKITETIVVGGATK